MENFAIPMRSEIGNTQVQEQEQERVMYANPKGDSETDGSGRPLPKLTPLNRDFWTCGADDELRILHCDACDDYIHPPAPLCPGCLSRDLSPRPVSGRGRIFSFTINHHLWRESLEVPYVVGLVELEEQPGLRLATNIVDCPPEDVQIGMAVEVVFERNGEVHVPLFRPCDPPHGGLER
jgi:uncharacterized OB-fold protein